ncbi:hypothetical protein H310_09096 [Aphanomyces invadans]|uniref:Lysosomal Pro-X carboxypeptidase n=1 Tax=Aphanomyces invadans TaxID=157072 RepID=A0A024TUM0_9STRA|nr:hypothetical protein H310_09096 [Aphanomyces invadans]ETV97723.1 hypothetical protein H310_09096 [Aphanomyces invadans]|eukprot:XP_008873284.1 hypothetical protein H310_09096 [Aphanomyces invadans]
MESAPLMSPLLPSRQPSAMSTKAIAAMLATVAGALVYVASSPRASRVADMFAGETIDMSHKRGQPTESFEGDLRLRCNETYITQTLDHFTAHHGTYEQRYFTCSEHWKSPNGPIFFYTGHESDAESFLKATGLMWENAAEFGALLVFAEHRYFGKSFPKIANASYIESLRWLSSEQALADYSVLVKHLKTTLHAEASPVISFGGSYAGMLSAWFRMKYPFVVDGAISSSAPLLAFKGQNPPVDPEAFSRITTFVGTPAAGSAANCVPNIRKAQQVIASWGATAEGRAKLTTALGLCSVPPSQDVAIEISDSLVSTYTELAEGNYPWPSDYFGDLPANPYRVACDHLKDDFANDEAALLAGFRASVGVATNSTGELRCVDWNSTYPIESENLWSYLACSELYMVINDQDGVRDFFRPSKQNETADAEQCLAKWGVELRPLWANTQYGGWDGIRAASNIVFSNGNFDPWGGYGVWESQSASVIAIAIDQGGHHLDLMFSNEADPQSVRDARELEKKEIRKWIDQKRNAPADSV